MEDGCDTLTLQSLHPGPLKNGQVALEMANCPPVETETPDTAEVNGSSDGEKKDSEEHTDSDSSSFDALVIDESIKSNKAKTNGKRIKKPKTVIRKKFKKIEPVPEEIPVKEEEIIEEEPQVEEATPEVNSVENDCGDVAVVKEEAQDEGFTGFVPQVDYSEPTNCLVVRKSPQPLQEYAQYLGLQPTVQFKCVRCKCAGFETLASLNEHSMQCTATEPVVEPSTSKRSTTHFKIQRRVFLCSVCGTYYENWNLFLHMREVHKRFCCLFCLGMFSQPERLCAHLISKHNCSLGQLSTREDFFNKYKEPCFLMCIDCEKVFSEQDNFYNHQCIDKISIKPVRGKGRYAKKMHVTGDDTPDKPMVLEENTNSQEFDQASNQTTVSNELSNQEKLAESAVEFSDSAKPIENLKEHSVLEGEESVNEPELETVKEENEDDLQESIDEVEDESVDNAVTNDLETCEDLPGNHCEAGAQETSVDPPEEVRKVPKLSLKLSNFTPYNSGDENDDRLDSDGSDGLVMEVDNAESENDEPQAEEDANIDQLDVKIEPDTDLALAVPQYQVAGADIPIIELELEHPLDKFEIRALIQRCLNATVSICIYCNHARKIAVNGKQLGLHAIAEHRFSAVVNSITAEELIPESFNSRIKDSFHELENIYFNLETSAPEEAITFSHVFECFQCRYSTTVHKELYLHNRKMHAKTILLCIMCKSNFYSYSELVCHLCPGVYVLDSEVGFRCCMCVSDDLPSAFRLMVHLRKRHHACDVCLELCNNQSRLSNHVWKHKLHHFCYRCGIAYRNKPDITKHLFWKHGTESVLCKRCLNKKWPHVYHFCMPPATFTCEECNLSFSKAVSLMVHKRLHIEEKPHACTIEGCEEKFISKKLLAKHEFKHREPEEQPVIVDDVASHNDETDTAVDTNKSEEVEKPQIIPKDIYDLPELNLSESDSSDSETEAAKPSVDKVAPSILDGTPVLSMDTDAVKPSEDTLLEPAPILENIWDNFKNYQASKEKTDNMLPEPERCEILEDIPRHYEPSELLDFVNKDHDYCYGSTKDEIKEIVQDEKSEVDKNVDHDYCTGQNDAAKKEEETKPAGQTAKKPADSSDSSSDSDSSSCTCGSNCSCSSSSGSSSSTSESSGSDSSTSEGRRKKLQRKEQRKQLKAKAKEQAKNPQANVTVPALVAVPIEIVIQESDLETTESDTDEDFYDKHPQRLAKQLLEEKRKKLLQMASGTEPLNGNFIETSRPSTPSLPEEMKPKKKSKSKKKKKKKSSKYAAEAPHNIPSNNNQVSEAPIVSPFSIFARQSPITQYGSPREGNVLHHTPMTIPSFNHRQQANMAESDTNLRASKRRRVPNKFYGYSSDEEAEKVQPPASLKWRKTSEYTQPTPMVVPPLTIKNIPPPAPKQIVEPISIRTSSNPGEFRVQNLHGAARPPLQHNRSYMNDAASDSNDTTSDEDEEPTQIPQQPVKETTQLYCYCRCPYDEVSEMIGCDNKNCAIEWFHFECVGIMVPPKGQWYCPDCRKKKQQRRELQ